jgi:lysophospholipase L1-like esterase
MNTSLSHLLTLTCIVGFAGACLASEAKPVPAKPTDGRPALLDGVKKILFLGDSLTDGSSYPDMVINTLNKAYPDAGFEIINSGMCGDTTSNLVVRLQADVLDRDPDLVLLVIGTNDCMYDRPMADFRKNLAIVLDALKQRGIKVMLILPSHFTLSFFEDRFQRYLTAMKEIAAERNLPVADVHGAFLAAQQKGLKVVGPDGVHHGPDGFKVKAQAVLDALGVKEPIDTVTRPWPGLQLEWETSQPVPFIEATNNPTLTAATGWQPFDRAKAIASVPWHDADYPRRGAWMPFAVTPPPQKSMAFGRTLYIAQEAGSADLWVGGSAPLYVWFNGVAVWSAERPKGYHPAAVRIPVTLVPGTNTVTVMANFMAFAGIKPSVRP